MIQRAPDRYSLLLPALICICFCCSQKQKTEAVDEMIADSLAERDSTPIKRMPDTLQVSAARPLIVTQRNNRDSVHIFPYSLLFESPLVNTFIVSFNDFSPTLVTLDTAGSIIDSMTLIGNTPKETPGFRIARFVRLSSRIDIVTTDSIYRWDVDHEQKRIELSKRVEINFKRYRIDAGGMIRGPGRTDASPPK